MSPKIEQMLAYFRANPGQTSKNAASALNASHSGAAARLKYLYDRGFVERQEIQRTVSNAPVYGYVVVKNPKKPQKPLSVVEKPLSAGGKPGAKYKRRKHDVESMDALVDNMAAVFADRFLEVMRARLDSGLRQLMGAPQPNTTPPAEDPKAALAPLLLVHPPAPPEPARARQKKVAVVGLMPAQAGAISTEFHDAFDLRFPERSNTNAVKLAAVQCDKVFIMTKFISHKVERAVQGANLTRINGGMTELRTALTAYFTQSQSVA